MEYFYKLFLKFLRKVNNLQSQKVTTIEEKTEDPEVPTRFVNNVRLAVNNNNIFVETDKDIYLQFPNIDDNNIHKMTYVIKNSTSENVMTSENTIRDTDEGMTKGLAISKKMGYVIGRLITVKIKCDLTNNKTYCVNGFNIESPIRDTDMAEEMVNYSKSSGMKINRAIDNVEQEETEETYTYDLFRGDIVVIDVIIVKNNYIVNVVGGNMRNSMLAQANQSNQGVLSLFV